MATSWAAPSSGFGGAPPPPAPGPPSRGTRAPRTYAGLLVTRLTTNEHRIKELTKQAEMDYRHDPNLGAGDVRSIVRFMMERAPDERKAALYLIDYISRKLPVFRPLIEPHIVRVFCHTILHGTVGIKQTCFKLLDLWRPEGRFPPRVFEEVREELERSQAAAPAAVPTTVPMAPAVAGPQPMDVIRVLVQRLHELIANPLAFGGGAMIRGVAPGYVFPPQVVGVLGKIHGNVCSGAPVDGAVMGYMMRDLHAILTQLRGDGVDTSYFDTIFADADRSLRQQPTGAPMAARPPPSAAQSRRTPASATRAAASANSASRGSRGGDVEICPFYNTADGCSAGANCTMAHITKIDKKIMDKVKERSEGRFRVEDLVKPARNGELCNVYTYFGKENWHKSLSREHRRSTSLLISSSLSICPNCALRMPRSALEKHLSWHFEVNKTNTAQRSRPLFLAADEWIRDVGSLTDLAIVRKAKERENALARERQLKVFRVLRPDDLGALNCPVCGDGFDVKDSHFVAETDTWMLSDACYADGSTAEDHSATGGLPPETLPLVHRSCFRVSTGDRSLWSLKPDLDPLSAKVEQFFAEPSEDSEDSDQSSSGSDLDSDSDVSAVLFDPSLFAILAPAKKRRRLLTDPYIAADTEMSAVDDTDADATDVTVLAEEVLDECKSLKESTETEDVEMSEAQTAHAEEGEGVEVWTDESLVKQEPTDELQSASEPKSEA